jgi:hypothetical protein
VASLSIHTPGPLMSNDDGSEVVDVDDCMGKHSDFDPDPDPDFVSDPDLIYPLYLRALIAQRAAPRCTALLTLATRPARVEPRVFACSCFFLCHIVILTFLLASCEPRATR